LKHSYGDEAQALIEGSDAFSIVASAPPSVKVEFRPKALGKDEAILVLRGSAATRRVKLVGFGSD
jgi:hypothetical protein